MSDVTPEAPPKTALPTYVQGNGYTQPPSRTHTTALSACHIEVEDFVDRLRTSVEGFFPNNTYRYKEVHVLLLSWEDDDLGVLGEVVELEIVFCVNYGYDSVKRWEIPSLKPYSKLEDELYRFRKDHSSSDNLLLVYYAGHGYLDYSRLWKWAAYCDVANKPPSPTLDWYALQSGLEHAESDVLILLDSCASAGSSGGSKQFETQEGGTTELLAACGFETVAPGPGPHSFTNALIKELRDMSTLEYSFAVSMLHQRIVARLVHYSPQYSSERLPRQPPPELRATPVYISLGRDFRQKSIPLISFRNPQNVGGVSLRDSTGNTTAANSDWSQPDRTASAIKRLLGDDNAPKVLLAINLQGDHWQNFEQPFANWLKDMPIPADSITIEAVFHGLSTTILLAMPIAIWDLLPEHPSCSFVSFVQSPNLLPSPMRLLGPEQKIDNKFEGLTCIYSSINGPEREPTADVVLVYGAFGHPINSFALHVAEPTSEASWARESLPNRLEAGGIFPRIMTYGWNASAWYDPQSSNESAHGDLAQALKNFRTKAPTRPLVVIGQGVSGFLIKQLVIDTINVGFNERPFQNPIQACFFLAVPKSFEYSNLTEILPEMAVRQRPHNLLAPRAEEFSKISEEFESIRKEWSIRSAFVEVNSPSLVLKVMRKTLIGPTVPFASRPPDVDQTDVDRIFARLEDYETRFLVDDSDSMNGPRWSTTKEVMTRIASIAVTHDKNGVDVRFFNAYLEDEERLNLDTAEKVTKLFDNLDPEGPTPTADILKVELNRYIHKYKRNRNIKGLNLIVITDGEPSTGQDVEGVIVKYARILARLHAPPLQVGVQFVQVGNEQAAKAFLDSLDNDLQAKHNLDRDMVDTVPWVDGDEDRLYEKILLGGILKRLDNDEDQKANNAA